MDSPYVIDYTEDLSGPPPAYVAVGIDDYTVSVNRHTFDAGFIAFTIIFGIIIIAVVVSALVYAYYSNNINVNNSGTLLYVDDTPTMNSNVGSANFAADKTVGETNLCVHNYQMLIGSVAHVFANLPSTDQPVVKRSTVLSIMLPVLPTYVL
jgi:hypothetical protein